MKTKSGIYQIRNIVNGKRYIGSAVDINRRFRKHKNDAARGVHHSAHFQKAWDKHGKDAFVFELLFECGKNEILDREQSFIDKESPEYNIAKNVTAPMTGRRHSGASREKIASLKRGVKHSADRIKINSESHKGIAPANKGKKMSPEVCAKNSMAQMGKVLSDEHRKNISKGGIGLKKPDGWMKKHVERMKGNKNWLGKKHSEEWKKKASDRMTRLHEHNGVSKTSEEWAASFGITTKAFAARLKRWGNVDRIYVPRMQ